MLTIGWADSLEPSQHALPTSLGAWRPKRRPRPRHERNYRASASHCSACRGFVRGSRCDRGGGASQTETLAHARATLAINKPVIDALTRSADGVASISVTVSDIARESQMLSLNARIEAARSGATGEAFAVVAAEMSGLSGRTKLATDEIGERAAGIARDVGAAEDVVAAHEALAAEQDELLITSLDQAQRQREAAAELLMITTDTVDTVDRTAAAIRRVGANAVAAKMLARQLAKLGRSSSDGSMASQLR